MPDDRNKTTYTGRKRGSTTRVGVLKANSTQFSVTDGELQLAGAGLAMDTASSDSGTATPTAAGVITWAGGEGIDTSATANTVTVLMEAATTANVGGGEIATDAEAIAASVSTNKFLVPANLAAIEATNMTALSATSADALTGTSTTQYLTVASHDYLKTATDITFTQNPILQAIATTGVAPVGTDATANIMHCQEGEVIEVFNIGTQTIIAPRMGAAGLLVSLDLVDNDGVEYNWGALSGAKNVFTIGTSAAFYVEWRFTLADVTGCDPVGMGFRLVEANNKVLEDYNDMAWIGVSETDTTAVISLKTTLNNAATTTTNTTDAWTDGQTHTLKVLVSGAGVVTYTIDGAAPTSTAAFTFDSADEVMPFFHGLHGTTTPGAWNMVWVKCGLQ